MNENFKLIEEVFQLCERKLESGLSEADLRRLESLVQTNPACRRAYVEYMHQHGALHWAMGGEAEFPVENRQNPVPFPMPEPSRNRWALAASILFAATLISLALRSHSPKPVAFATLTETKNVQWGPGQFPTEIGSRIGPGRLRLTDGFATILFDNGVRLVLESPADVEFVSAMNCVLHEGIVVAKVSPAAKGFSVKTPTARLVDYGTEFGVTANAKGETQVQVFEGIVDVEPLNSNQTNRLTKGKNFRVTSTQSAVADTQNFETQRLEAALQPVENSAGTITLTTAFGRGKDAYVQTEPRDEHGSDVLLLVKNASSESFRRKAYLGFDLAGIPVEKIESARLILTMAPSGYGYASFTPECTFTVYGLTEQSLDGWRESDLRWDNAPANVPARRATSGYEIDTTKARRLASFQVPEGVSSGEFTVSDPALIDFLRQDENGIVTFIIVRETGEPRSGSLVHGFVSRRNPTVAPPTLRITLQQNNDNH